MLGLASAETSAIARLAQKFSFCQEGFGSYAEHPEPLPDHAVSVKPRASVAAQRGAADRGDVR